MNGDAPSTSAAAGVGRDRLHSGAHRDHVTRSAIPTRRGIYLFCREHAGPDSDGVTAAQVAEQFGLHPNVARHHLDKLAAGGYLEVAIERARPVPAPAARRSATARRGRRHRSSSRSAATTSC